MANEFEQLLNLNVNDKLEIRKGENGIDLSYLSWAYAWAEFKKVYPDAQYEVVKFADKESNMVPYMFDDLTGYMCNTKVTAGGLTYEMWLPVMNSSNKAMKAIPYKYMTKKGERTVEAATMFDVNKTIMRCLVKNLAMFGLGLYVYAGEDLPDNVAASSKTTGEISEDLEDTINNCFDENELKKVYQENKKTICANPQLLAMITTRGRALRQIADEITEEAA